MPNDTKDDLPAGIERPLLPQVRNNFGSPFKPKFLVPDEPSETKAPKEEVNRAYGDRLLSAFVGAPQFECSKDAPDDRRILT